MNLRPLANWVGNAAFRPFVLRTLMGGLVALSLMHSDRPCYAVIIDSFDDSSMSSAIYPTDTGFRAPVPVTRPTVADPVAFNSQFVTDSLNSGVIAGGTRAGHLEYTTGSGNNFISASINPNAPGTFNIGSVDDDGFVRLEYSVASGYQPLGSGGSLLADLTGYGTLEMDVIFFNPGTGNGETVELFLEDSNGVSLGLTQSLAVSVLSWDLTDAAFSGIDLSDIRRIFFEFEIAQGTDIRVDSIQALAVPEPASLVVWSGLGVAFLLCARAFSRRGR